VIPEVEYERIADDLQRGGKVGHVARALLQWRQRLGGNQDGVLFPGRRRCRSMQAQLRSSIFSKTPQKYTMLGPGRHSSPAPSPWGWAAGVLVGVGACTVRDLYARPTPRRTTCILLWKYRDGKPRGGGRWIGFYKF
jgi:hypothetical protein